MYKVSKTNKFVKPNKFGLQILCLRSKSQVAERHGYYYEKNSSDRDNYIWRDIGDCRTVVFGAYFSAGAGIYHDFPVLALYIYHVGVGDPVGQQEGRSGI